MVGQGIYLDEATDTLGGFCRMVRSSVVVVGGSASGLRAGKGGAFGVWALPIRRGLSLRPATFSFLVVVSERWGRDEGKSWGWV